MSFAVLKSVKEVRIVELSFIWTLDRCDNDETKE
jgi:hypothetical protein